jgi:hypothetical protein
VPFAVEFQANKLNLASMICALEGNVSNLKSIKLLTTNGTPPDVHEIAAKSG